MRIFGTVTRSFLQFTVCLTFPGIILLAADPCQASGSSRMWGTLVRSDSSNMFFMAINTSVDLPGQENTGGAPDGVVISNGLYRIDINADIDVSEEMLPANPSSRFTDINQALAIYSKLSGRELKVDENVRQFQGLFEVPQHSEMTRTQACDWFEAMLLQQAGLEITKPDNDHAIVGFRLRSDAPTHPARPRAFSPPTAP